MSTDDDDFEIKPTPSRGTHTGHTPKSYRLTEQERAMQRRRPGVPVVRPDPADEVTAPIALLINGQLETDDYAQIEALRRSTDDPYVLLMNLAKAMSRHRDKEQSSSRGIEKQVLAAIEEQSKNTTEMANRISNLETDGRETKRKLGFAQKVAAGAITIAIAAAGGLLSKIWDRAGDEREAKVKQVYMQQDIDRLTKQYEWLARQARKDTP